MNEPARFAGAWFWLSTQPEENGRHVVLCSSKCQSPARAQIQRFRTVGKFDDHSPDITAGKNVTAGSQRIFIPCKLNKHDLAWIDAKLQEA